MSTQNYYQILGISMSATQEEIKKAFRNLSKKYHPDVNPSEEAEIKMKTITQAYNVLSDPLQRRKYDSELKIQQNEYKYQEFYQSYKEEKNVDIADIIFDFYKANINNYRKDEQYDVPDEKIKIKVKKYVR
ncbi:MAG: J domain-containing protein [Lactobacillales bacterium]|nr:J domain-containing protein [Lactobacillales bacterium]